MRTNFSDGMQLLDLVNVVTGKLPHSNQAAKSARNDALALQAKFGFPAVFLSVTPDDTNTFIVQAYTRKKECAVHRVNVLNEQEMKSVCAEGEKIRIKCPGLCAIWFECILRIVMKNVVGWDYDKNRRANNHGFYGKPDAVLVTVEEQSRKSLHAHIIIWLQDYNNILDDLQEPDDRLQNKAKKLLIKQYDRTVTTSIIQNPTYEMFKHDPECDKKYSQKYKKTLPPIVAEQALRDLHHKEGCIVREGAIAACKSTVTRNGHQRRLFLNI